MGDFLGRGATPDPDIVDIAAIADASGDILIRGAAGWERLPKGSDGNVLTLASGLPSWAAASGAASVTANYIPYGDGTSTYLSSSSLQWVAASSSLRTGNPTVGANDGGSLIVGGIARFSTGLQSYGVGTGATIGNARGTGAIDLQVKRNNAAKVASGTNSTISGGENNTASTTYCTVSGGEGNTASTNSGATVVGGVGNTASGQESVAGGGGNTASGTHSVALGNANQATTTYAAVLGGSNAKADHIGEVAHAAGAFSVAGDAQYSDVIWRKQTTTSTQAELFLEGSSARFTLDNDTTYTFDILFVARRTDADDESAGYRAIGVIDRNANAASTALVGTVTYTTIGEDTAAWDVAVDADTTNGSLRLQVTGENAKTIRWVAAGRIVKVTG